MTLHLAKGLDLSDDAVTETFWWTGIRGSGKTHNCSVFVEELLRIGAQVIIFDPVSAWWGLRSAKNGRGPGFPIAIFGGPRADVPLEPEAGTFLADLAVDERVSMILDLKGWSKAARRRFVTDFLERLLVKNDRQAVHVVLEETPVFAPQRPQRDELRMLGAVEELVRLGRGSGIGSSIISQRSATVNKEVSTQTEIVVAHRTPSPQDRAALKGWFDVHLPGRVAEAMTRVPRLATGSAVVSSTNFLNDFFGEVRFRPRTTFDSSATPKIGEARRDARTFADIDLAAIKHRMAETIRRAEEDDPRVLRRRIVELERQLKEMGASRPEPVIHEIEVPVIDAALVQQLRGVAAAVGDAGSQIDQVSKVLIGRLDGVAAGDIRGRPSAPAAGPGTPPPTAGWSLADPPNGTGGRAAAAGGKGPAASGLSKQPAAMLAELARRHPMRVTRSQLATLTGYSLRSSSFAPSLAALRSAGLIEEARGEIRVTSAGLAAGGVPHSAPPATTSAELLEMWRRRLPRQAGVLLGLLAEVFPAALSRAQLGERSGYSLTSSSFGTSLGVLRRNGLIAMDGDEVRAADVLFVAGVDGVSYATSQNP